MGKLDAISAWCGNLGATLASMAKIVLLSKRATVRKTAKPSDEIVILGNGPSLNETVAAGKSFLATRKKLAVNFAANAPLFFDLRPEYYVLADPHFFLSEAENVVRLWDTFLRKVDWDMTLFVPAKEKSDRIGSLKANGHVRMERYNTTPVEGFPAFRHAAYRAGWGMPRPRNVLIPSIMLALETGFKTIYVAGADHSWMKTLSVDGNNRVVSIQPHFYKETDKEKARVDAEYMNYPLHQIVYSFYVAFKSYHTIRHYAERIGATIWNITPGSFIDAFPRKAIE